MHSQTDLSTRSYKGLHGSKSFKFSYSRRMKYAFAEAYPLSQWSQKAPDRMENSETTRPLTKQLTRQL